MKPFLLFISVMLSNLSAFTLLLNGLDSCKNVAGSAFDEVEQIWGLEGRAGKSLFDRAFGKKGLRVLRANAVPLHMLSGTCPVSP